MMQAKTRLPWLLLLLWLPITSAFAQPDLTVGSATGQPGATVSTAVSFTNNGAVVAMSFEITFNPALVTPGPATPGAALAPHTVATNISAPGTLSVAITPPIINPLPTVNNGILLTIPWTISAGSAPATTALTLTNVAFANAQQGGVPPDDLTSGQITILAASATSANIPTLSEWALLLLSGLLGGMVWRTQARRANFRA